MNWHTRVRDVMSGDPVSVDVNDPPSRVQQVLSDRPFHHLSVIDGGVLVGVVSTVDLARVSLGAWVKDGPTQQAWLDATFQMKDVMTFEPECIHVDDPIKLAADKLSAGSFHCLPVLDDADQLVGMLTSTDLIRFLVTA
mgnify:FL=1